MSRSLIAFRNSQIPYLTESTWRAAVNYITDADTIWVERDTGCREAQLIELRVTGDNWKGFNAAERFTANGKLATGSVQQLCPVGSIIRIETKPDTEKYGRWLSPVLIPLLHWEQFDPQVRVTKAGIEYLDLASYLVSSVPGCVWQEY